MTLTYFTYYDHIERARYNPYVIVENWKSCDRRIVFCNTSELGSLAGIDAEVIDIHMGISTPGDIPRALNACMRTCYEQGADQVVHVLGDQYITEAGDKVLANCASERLVGYIPCMFVQLYVKQWIHPYTCTISNKDYQVRFSERGDGQELMYPDSDNVLHIPMLSDREDLLLDTGYLGMPQFYGKMYNHNFIWPDRQKVQWLNTFKFSREKAIKLAYAMLKRSKGVNLEAISYELYGDLIYRLGLESDYEECIHILSQL